MERKTENVKNFKVFGSKFYIKREDGRLGKFESRVDKGILVGYSSKRKAYKCFSPRLNKIVEIFNVTIDEIDVWKDKEGRKHLEENDDEEYVKEEEAKDEE
jgi:hypothetical protein